MTDKIDDSTKHKILHKDEEKVLTYKIAKRLLSGRQKLLQGFESEIFPIKKPTRGKGLKILNPKHGKI